MQRGPAGLDLDVEVQLAQVRVVSQRLPGAQGDFHLIERGLTRAPSAPASGLSPPTEISSDPARHMDQPRNQRREGG